MTDDPTPAEALEWALANTPGGAEGLARAEVARLREELRWVRAALDGYIPDADDSDLVRYAASIRKQRDEFQHRVGHLEAEVRVLKQSLDGIRERVIDALDEPCPDSAPDCCECECDCHEEDE